MVKKNEVLESKSKFLKKVYNIPMTDCIFFEGYHDQLGYGQFQFRYNGAKKNTAAHRASYIIATQEELTTEDVIMHSCDNPSCINPQHLSKGTHNDNVQDRVRKGRSAVGVKNGNHKLFGL